MVRMVMGRQGNLLLGRAHIDDNLVLCPEFLEAVQNLHDHLHGRPDGNGDDDDIRFTDTSLKRDDRIDQADLFRCRGIDRLRLHADHPVCEAPAAQVDGHGTSYQAESDDSYRHTMLLTLARADSSFSTGLQREERI